MDIVPARGVLALGRAKGPAVRPYRMLREGVRLAFCFAKLHLLSGTARIFISFRS
jgi:hypothetical protein